jgi:hypothetical protein
MLIIDPTTKRLIKATESNLAQEELKERCDLQAAIVKSWENFREEIALPTAILIGSEINPHPSTGDAIDLLAYDPQDSSLVVIELKRDRNKLQLLQALTYAAMVSKWDQETLLSKIRPESQEGTEELEDLIKANPLTGTVKIVLVSEYYDPEVILTADWLSTYELEITAFSLRLFRIDEQILMSVEQRFPLKVLEQAYEPRTRKAAGNGQSQIQWEDVLPKLKYPFAARGLELCRKVKPGEPSRRRFGWLRTNWDGFDWIGANFRAQYINLYMKGSFADMATVLQSKFSEPIEVNTWAGGLSCNIDTEQKFTDMVTWLKLE